MSYTKIVNGEVIELSQEEVDALLIEWAEGDKNIQRNSIKSKIRGKKGLFI